MDITTTISAEVTDVWSPDEMGGGCYADHTVRIAVGEKTLDVTGWVCCGWLTPGANQNLDGSGLANWGDSQPGGWSVCDGDGASTGRVRTSDPRQPDAFSAIVVGADNNESVSVWPADVPEWDAAVTAARAAGESEEATMDAYDDLLALAAAIRKEVIDALDSALDDAYDAAPDLAPEPDAETVWDSLDRHAVAEADGEDLVRLGDWNGAGLCLAWRTEDGHDFAWHPTEDDVRNAVAGAAPAMESEIEAARLRIVRESEDGR